MGSSSWKIVAGLGNPGRQYAKTRHNAGFMVVDELARRWSVGEARKAFGGLLAEARPRVGEVGPPPRVLLLKPQTYMNRSGQSVKGLSAFYRVEPKDVLVVLDEMSLKQGQLRVRPGGSGGGHNGLSDVLNLMGTTDVPRLRIGIGRPRAEMDPADYVLGRFGDDELEIITKVIDLGARAVEDWLEQPMQELMTKYNGTNLRREAADESEEERI